MSALKIIAYTLKPKLNTLLKLQRNTLSTKLQDISSTPKKYNEDDELEIIALDPFKPVGASECRYLETLAPPLKRSFNFAAYVNHVDTLQSFVKLGVSLFDIENVYPEDGRYLTALDFQKDCVDHIKFLLDNGVRESSLGRFITQYPKIFKESLENLQIRINYLESKGFSPKKISMILNKNALILAQKIKILDANFGILQTEFSLTDAMLRQMIVKHPDVALLPKHQYKLIRVCLLYEFGFTDDETKQLVTKAPYVIDITRPSLIKNLDLVHNIFGFTHEQILSFPQLITGPLIEMRNRYSYLVKLKRNQFEPSQPLYVPPSALYEPDDVEFCSKYAKTTIEDYKKFLKAT